MQSLVQRGAAAQSNGSRDTVTADCWCKYVRTYRTQPSTAMPYSSTHVHMLAVGRSIGAVAWVSSFRGTGGRAAGAVTWAGADGVVGAQCMHP